MGIGERVTEFLKWGPPVGAMARGLKEAAFPAGRRYQILPMQATWSEPSAENSIKYGYKQNSAVFACIRALATAFSEPPLKVYDRATDKELPNHPLRQLIVSPNEIMGEDELMRYLLVYKALGGNAYLHKVRSGAGIPVELWPYHDVAIQPVSSGTKWVEKFQYDYGDGRKEDIPTRDIAHFKWMPDPERPYRGMGPLTPVSREVDSDNELTRYLKALLENDAIPRTALKVPAAQFLTPEQKAILKADFNARHGGAKRGGLMILEGGAELERISLDMQELAFDALRGVPEARIAAAFGVPAIVAGLNIGLQRSTFANFAEARKMFTEQTLVPLWRSVEAEIQSSLAPDFGGNIVVRFDLSKVRALGEDENAKRIQVRLAAQAGIFLLNEARSEFNLPAIEGGDVTLPEYLAARAVPGGEPSASEKPGGDEPSANGNTGKGIEIDEDLEQKALGKSIEALGGKIEAKMKARLEDLYGDVAAHLES